MLLTSLGDKKCNFIWRMQVIFELTKFQILELKDEFYLAFIYPCFLFTVKKPKINEITSLNLLLN